MDALIETAPDAAPESEVTSTFAWKRHVAALDVPTVAVEHLVPHGRRAVVVAPHPDDEVLATGGLLAQLARRGRPPLVVAVTDGDASHPRSVHWTRARLAATRPLETNAALARLGMLDVRPLRLRIPDGRVATHEQKLATALLDLVRPGDVVFTPFLLDGHPDHEATARATLEVAAARRAACIQVPIWLLYRAHPDDARIPWRSACRLRLDAATVAAKRAAVHAFRSQIEADPVSGDAPVLDARMLARWLGEDELYFTA